MLAPRALAPGGMRMVDGVVPPHDTEAEMSVLGAILLDPLVFGEVSEELRAEDFYREAHRQIYETIVALQARDLEVDMVTVSGELEKTKRLEQIGGRAYLVELVELLPSTANARSYAKIVSEHAQRRRLARAGEEVRRLALQDLRPIGEVMDESEQLVFDVGGERTGQSSVQLGSLLETTFERIERLGQQAGVLTGLDTGYYRVNDLTGGLQEGEMIVVAARPSMGKTTFSINMARNACLAQGARVLLFSLEMMEEQIVQNVLCAEARVDATKIRRGQLSDRDWARMSDAAGRLHEAPFFVDATPGLTPLAIRAKARRVARKMGGLDLVIVDYLQLVNASGGSGDSRQHEISVISRSLKALARDLSCPVIAISQLNRAVDAREDHRPRLSDLRESGAIEQDADIICFLYRADYYDPDQQAEDGGGSETEVIVAKNRNGPTGVAKLLFLRSMLRFENLATEEPPPG